MKFFRFGPVANERPGVLLDDGRAVDVSAFGEDYDERFFASEGFDRLAAWLVGKENLPTVDLGTARFASAIVRPSKIVCVGLNYRSHAIEMGSTIPREPKLFMKATTALAGMSDPVVRPRASEALDYEVELALVIGRRCRYVAPADALGYVAAFTMMNDYSEREFQKNREGQWVKGKSADTFAPVGPFLVRRGELDPADLRLALSVNGEVRQDQRTSDLIFDVATIVSNISQYMTLVPGDLVSTGTPGGVGLGFSPPRYLVPGDEVRYSIEGIGEAVQRVVDDSTA